MASDDLINTLHDTATRGEGLSMEEQEQLENWYAQQDQAESQVLSVTHVTTLAALKGQVEAALNRLLTTTKHVQEIAAENDVMRREVAALRHQLAGSSTPQPA